MRRRGSVSALCALPADVENCLTASPQDQVGRHDAGTLGLPRADKVSCVCLASLPLAKYTFSAALSLPVRLLTDTGKERRAVAGRGAGLLGRWLRARRPPLALATRAAAPHPARDVRGRARADID